MAIDNKILFDKTEIVFIDTYGKRTATLNLTYDKIVSVQFENSTYRKLFKVVPSEKIKLTIRGREEPLYLLEAREKAEYWQGYKDGLAKFCKDNRVSFHNDLTK